MRALVNKLEVLVTFQQLPLGYVIVETFHSMAPTIWSHGSNLPNHIDVYRKNDMQFNMCGDAPRWWVMTEEEVIAKYSVIDLANECTVSAELMARARPLS